MVQLKYIYTLIFTFIVAFSSIGFTSESYVKNDKEMNPVGYRLASKALNVDKEHISVKNIKNDFFKKWKFCWASDDSIPPRSVVVATTENKAIIIDSETAYSHIVSSENVNLESIEVKIDYVKFVLSLIKPYSYVLNTIDDIPFVDKNKYKILVKRIEPPTAKPKWIANNSIRIESDEPSIYIWIWEKEKLYQGVFNIKNSGLIESKLEIVNEKIGISIPIL